MIFSENSDAHREEFVALLSSVVRELNESAKKSQSNSQLLRGRELEPYIKSVMDNNSTGTSFAGTIQLVSGQKFPDIIARRFYGVEVKSTIQNHWITTGNSVTETTRVKDVERIFMMFGKLAHPMEFKCRPYESCLSEVVVTHSPRYLIDMQLEEGHTIFDKMQVPYDELRKLSEPIEPIKDYYGKKLQPGKYSWWLPVSTNLLIKLWTTLNSEEKHVIRVKGFTLFPELFSKGTDKYDRLALWMVQNESVVCKSMRDVYTAGGQETMRLNNNNYKNIPRIIVTCLSCLNEICDRISDTETEILARFWSIPVNAKRKHNSWFKLVVRQCQISFPGLHVMQLFEDYMVEKKIKFP